MAGGTVRSHENYQKRAESADAADGSLRLSGGTGGKEGAGNDAPWTGPGRRMSGTASAADTADPDGLRPGRGAGGRKCLPDGACGQPECYSGDRAVSAVRGYSRPDSEKYRSQYAV